HDALPIFIEPEAWKQISPKKRRNGFLAHGGIDKKGVLGSWSTLEGHITFIQVIITVHRTSKGLVPTGQVGGHKGVLLIGVHLRLELKGGIKVIQVIEFAQRSE